MSEIGRRRERRLAHAHTHARQQQLAEVPRRAASRGHEAPDADPPRDDRAPAPLVGQPRDRESQHGVEEGEREPAEQAHLGIGEAEIALDRVNQQGEDLAIDVRGDIGEREDARRRTMCRRAAGRRADGRSRSRRPEAAARPRLGSSSPAAGRSLRSPSPIRCPPDTGTDPRTSTGPRPSRDRTRRDPPPFPPRCGLDRRASRDARVARVIL